MPHVQASGDRLQSKEDENETHVVHERQSYCELGDEGGRTPQEKPSEKQIGQFPLVNTA